MASITQLAANRINSLHSTGPITNGGKTKSSRNAIRHGLVSARLLLDDEEGDEFQELLDGLAATLRPVGALELALVERIALSLWRQRRLIRAETAGIELSRRRENATNREQIEIAMGRGLQRPVTVEEVRALTTDELQLIARIATLKSEAETLDAHRYIPMLWPGPLRHYIKS